MSERSERSNGGAPDGGAAGGMPGGGLIKGLAVTLRTMTRPAHTQQYPDVAPELPPRSRGVIALLEENCTVCMLCARECPDWCIYIDSHKETVAVPGAARPRQRNVLDRFAIDFSLCMYCGICIEACPFDALYWTPEFEYAEYDIRDLLHEKDRLGEWMATVPPPPAHDPNGEPAKEETAAARRAAGPAAPAKPTGPAKSTGPAAPAKSTGPAATDRATGPAAAHKAASAKAGRAGGPGVARTAAGPAAASQAPGPTPADQTPAPAAPDQAAGPAASDQAAGPVAAEPASGSAAPPAVGEPAAGEPVPGEETG